MYCSQGPMPTETMKGSSNVRSSMSTKPVDARAFTGSSTRPVRWARRRTYSRCCKASNCCWMSSGTDGAGLTCCSNHTHFWLVFALLIGRLFLWYCWDWSDLLLTPHLTTFTSDWFLLYSLPTVTSHLTCCLLHSLVQMTFQCNMVSLLIDDAH